MYIYISSIVCIYRVFYIYRVVYLSIYIYISTYMYIYIYTNVYIYTHIHIYVYIYIHTCIYMCTHAHIAHDGLLSWSMLTHTHRHTHTHTLVLLSWPLIFIISYRYQYHVYHSPPHSDTCYPHWFCRHSQACGCWGSIFFKAYHPFWAPRTWMNQPGWTPGVDFLTSELSLLNAWNLKPLAMPLMETSPRNTKLLIGYSGSIGLKEKHNMGVS